MTFSTLQAQTVAVARTLADELSASLGTLAQSEGGTGHDGSIRRLQVLAAAGALAMLGRHQVVIQAMLDAELQRIERERREA